MQMETVDCAIFSNGGTVLASSCSSDISTSPSLVALVELSFSPPLIKIVCFCLIDFSSFNFEVDVISYKGVLSFASD